MTEGKLYEETDNFIPYNMNERFKKEVLDAAKAEFQIKYEYDAWEIPETNAQKEKALCKVLAWYQKYFGGKTQ